MSDAIDLNQSPDGAAESSRLLPVGSAGERSGGWWGCLTLIATEGALFGYLIFSYLYLASQSTQHWPPEGLPKLGLGIANTVILLSSSGFVWLCECCVRRRRLRWGVASMAVGVVLGCTFMGIQLIEWHDHPYGLTTHLYGSLYFTITGFHMAHVAVGIVVLLLLLLWTALGYFDEKRCAALTIGGLYWHFVDVVWLFIFSTLYLSPYLFRGWS
ncbi:cytochrome c oxidase subunit 3 [Paraburkholderia fungorum]|uniref:Cytochrome c oxidase subunit 3 n=1 Tax=Paraburkholderia fungorum TaxID=134537 RepID=A0A1H1JNA4_9BURK|nr:cytochrome c oxidase subunit 3 [Paraburkholderia fungorum]SDR51474.1 cytochrome c oxidase subunit 3 [Paraburkholderia fungorum]